MKKISYILIGLLFLSLLGVGIWFFFFRSSDTATTYSPAQAGSAKGTAGSAADKAPARAIPAGESEYRNEFYHISLLYPQGVAATERKGAGTTLTLVFTDPQTSASFQMYILPYGEAKISKERFLTDDPSGIMASSSILSVGGTSTSAFYSKDAVLGDTYEMWFVNKGFLYEATTYAQLDTWMSDMLKSLEFI